MEPIEIPFLLAKATGMALDIPNNHLYYFNQMNSSTTYDIMRVDLDGNNDQLIYDASTYAQTLRLDLDEQKIWMVLSGGYKIQKLNMDGTGLETIIPSTGNASDMSLDLIGALPVELSFFKADIHNGKMVLLEWQTASENNNAGFEVERSTDRSNWQNIGFVDGIGSSTLVNPYQFTDEHPRLGDNYYRLKQIDFDGKHDYSELRQVFFDAKVTDLLYVYPNPVADHFTVGILNPEGKSAQIKLFDSTHRLIYNQSFKPGEMNDFWEKEFTLPQREMYFIVTQIGQETMSKKIVPIKR
ncbi:MAG: hypothetical protein ACI8P3_003242 [Saprospiraceae bacterium]|jgi:hypothetical protein